MINITYPTYVPFEPRAAAQREARIELRRRLSELRAKPGEILYASFAGALPARADVENALFYNLDGSGVFSAMREGVSFEVDPIPLARAVRYSYETGPVEAAFRYWREARPLATFDAYLGDARPKLAGIWWALRSTYRAIESAGVARPPNDPFAMTLDVEAPAQGLTAGLLKTVLDGTICSLQSENETAQAVVVAPVIAAGLGVSADAVLNNLVDNTRSALGPKPRFVHPHGRGVKWEPDDDDCMAARVLFARADRWRIRGHVATVLRK